MTDERPPPGAEPVPGAATEATGVGQPAGPGQPGGQTSPVGSGTPNPPPGSGTRPGSTPTDQPNADQPGAGHAGTEAPRPSWAEQFDAGEPFDSQYGQAGQAGQ